MSWDGGQSGRNCVETKINIEDYILSNFWSTRKEGYEEAAANFRKPDLRGKNWGLFLQLVKSLTAERNVPALEKGLEAVLAFVENCSIVDDELLKCALHDVVKKALLDVKPRIKELANRICMALYDRKKHEMVTDMLLEGIEARNSKHAFSCIRTLTNALTGYGPSCIHIPTVATKIVALCADKVMFQQDVKDLLREIYKWNGPDVKERYMKLLDASQRKAMDIEFAKVDCQAKSFHKSSMSIDSNKSHVSVDSRPKSASLPLPRVPAKNNRPSSTSQAIKGVSGRLSSPKSLQFTTEKNSSKRKKVSDRSCGDRISRKSHPSAATVMDLADIFVMMESKIWGERKEALEELHTHINEGTTMNAVMYGKMIKRLRVLILEDTNVVLVAKAIKCVTALAKSQSKEFQQHVPLMMTLLLEKFKEKKGIVIEAIREAIDSIYSSFQFGGITRYVALSLASSNPSVKAETATFVQRCFTRPTPALRKVNNWQPLVQQLVNNLTFPDQIVRESAMKALGTMLHVLGNEPLASYMKKVPRHQALSIFKHCTNAEVFMQTSSCTDTTLSVDIDSDSDRCLHCSSADASKKGTKINTLLPGFKPQAKAQLVYSSDESVGSINKETDHRNSRSISQRIPSPSISARPHSTRNRKSLSPASIQRLANFRSEIKQIKQAKRDVQEQQPQFQTQGGNFGTTEEKITKKLQDLEEAVSKCFKEVHQLSPQLYKELEYSSKQSSGDVIRNLNQKLYEMERLLKSMAFEIGPSTFN